MRQNVVRLFSLYNFFSVFLPGFVFLLGIVPLLPRDALTDATTALVPLLALGFVVGQAVHSLAVWGEKAFGHERHRTRFSDELDDQTSRLDHGLVREFRTCYANSSFEVPLLFPDEDESDDREIDYASIYTLVQSYVHTEDIGRSRIFQAIYAFCRSLWFGSFFLTLLYWSVVIYVVTANADPEIFLLTTGPLSESVFLSTIVCGTCVFVFKYAADQYQEHFVQYLLADFVVLSRRSSDE